MVLLSSVSVFAGDIPESLLHEKGALLYFGDVLVYDPEYVSETGDKGYIELAVGTIIKGEQGGKRTAYSDIETVGEFEIVPQGTYLFAYLNENNPVYVMETTSEDTKTLEIKNIHSEHQFKRLEQYLNEGKFELVEETADISTTETQTSDTDTAPQIDMEEDHQDFISQNLIKYIVAGAVVLVVLILSAILIIKRKSK